jgi:superfamily II DNA or RNA helicase
MAYFSEHSEAVRPLWRGLPDGMGDLRKSQLGAVWAVASHFTVSDTPAVASLPTGVGKTALMCLLPFLVPTTRVAVVAPTTVVRDQIVDEFKTMRVLKQAGAGEGPGWAVLLWSEAGRCEGSRLPDECSAG